MAGSHDEIVDRAEDSVLGVGDLLHYDSLEFLLLPDTVRGQLGTPLDTELPGSNPALDADLDLLLSAPQTLHVPSLDAGEGPVDTSSTDPAGPAETTSQHDPSTLSGSSSEAVLEPAVTTSGTQGPTSQPHQTQGAQAPAQNGDASAAAEAWQALSPAAKTALAAGAAFLLLLGPLAMYSRITRDETLENGTRRNIYEIVEASPGLCIKDIADRADVSYSTASYHLNRLVKTDYLVKNDQGNKVLYYKNGGTFTQDERELVPILKNPECMAVFEKILEHPWCYRAEVAEALGVSHTTVNWHLKRLISAELVEEHREGRNCHLYIGQPALDRVCGVLDKMETLGAGEELALQENPVPA